MFAAASWVIRARIGSSVLTNRFALNPHATDTYAVTIPATGCSLTDWNSVAAIGIRIIYPASPTILEITPSRITIRITPS